MKTPEFSKNPSLHRLSLAVLVMGGVLVSCATPPRQVWQRAREDGVLKALFVPPRTQAARERLLASPGGTGPGTMRRTPPTAEAFSGQQGYVYSPHTRPRKLVNVTAFTPGAEVLCPYTLEPFVVPASAPSEMAARQAPPADSPLWSDDLSRPAGETAASRRSPGPASRDPHRSDDPTSNPAVIEVASRDLSSSLLPAPAGPPYGKWVEGVPGRVYSPFASKTQQVDVSGLAPGVEVKCPYTGKIFRVPEFFSPESSTPSLPPTVPPLPEPMDHPAVEEIDVPAPAPEPVPLPAPDKPEEASPPAPRFGATKPAAESGPPTANWVGSDFTKVASPFGQPGEVVDVSGRAAGEKVICPFTGKPFLVPAR